MGDDLYTVTSMNPKRFLLIVYLRYLVYFTILDGILFIFGNYLSKKLIFGTYLGEIFVFIIITMTILIIIYSIIGAILLMYLKKKKIEDKVSVNFNRVDIKLNNKHLCFHEIIPKSLTWFPLCGFLFLFEYNTNIHAVCSLSTKFYKHFDKNFRTEEDKIKGKFDDDESNIKF